MYKMHQDHKATIPAPTTPSADDAQNDPERVGLIDWIKGFMPAQPKTDDLLREAIEEYIEEQPNETADAVSLQERELFSNILELRNIRVHDVMLPRADIAAIEIDATKEDILKLLAENPHSRFPVYKDTLDDVLGTVHIKDIVGVLARGQKIPLKDLLTDMPIVSPSLPILDLLLNMRKTRRHMVLVVDEYGGIDGLVTLSDVLETIIGEIDDEHDTDDGNNILEGQDGTFIADARVDIEDFEDRFGSILTPEEREESDTLGGLVFAMAGRVPSRGEILTHVSGMMFEILEADPRRISKLKIRNIPKSSGEQ